ncbi:MAG: hypothetical protein UT61_C0066G0010 [Candidatus Woesebacteria bacterium GW2011_GWA1_39_8]|jgi:secondary thiamine-phosphate synthase enzyme|uniref:Secondary thiamine-phosphate synthase enzyme n=1 Tax=Candidatus Woesebacteria bacterium GW2011_GWA1_39_8 TaxID=1618552 RepID=A0A0G0RZE4_9BACT|nr:MAG: hypothetical protein UT61_C0066G0010 [Candidatus Woesebacteria bacterium GW2011_GWA1_39_8]
MYTINIETTQKDEVVDITNLINDLISKSGERKGSCNIFVTHTTCSIATADLDPETDKDYLKAFRNMVPNLTYNHPHDPNHFGDHLLSTLIGTQISVPYVDGGLVLGDWQKVVLFEFNGPQSRRVVVNLE